MQCKYRDKLHLLILWKTYEAKSIVQYNRLITLQHGHFRRVRRMKNGGVWRRLAGSLLGTCQIYLCGAVRKKERRFLAKMRKDAGEIQEGKKKKAEASLCERDILFGHDQPLQLALFGHDQPLQPASVWTQPALKLALFGHSQPVPIPAGRGCARGEFLLPHVLRPLWNAAWQAVSG